MGVGMDEKEYGKTSHFCLFVFFMEIVNKC